MSFSSFNRILLLVLLLPVINACSPEKAASEIIPSTTANVVKEAERQVAVKPSFTLGKDFDIVREQASDTFCNSPSISLYIAFIVITVKSCLRRCKKVLAIR